MSRATVLLVDDHPIVRAGYVKLLEAQDEYRVIAEAETAAGAYQSYRKQRPDIVIMDMSLPGASGLEAIRLIHGFDRSARILVFTMHQGASLALKAFESGALGYVTKCSPTAELLRSMALILRGGRAISDDVAREIASERLFGRNSAIEDLGPREVEILKLIASGLSTDDIADALALSQKTVQNYHSSIKAKLRVRTDAKLVWIAIGAGLLGSNAAD